MVMGVYEECIKDKKLAAKVLLPLIEFEFGLIGDDKPTLVQSRSNIRQIKTIFEICRKHGWTTSRKLLFKKGNPYFRINTRDSAKFTTLPDHLQIPRKINGLDSSLNGLARWAAIKVVHNPQKQRC